ncbi:MAG: alcohol dehydrogenase [Epsilonproteobacteria bacterium]|nr:MAG: alcohol dehydrogenase [Campylobacterota bacterium]
MKNIQDIIVTKNTLLKDALRIIDKSSKQICLVLDNSKKLLGTISDGDIRRALLNNISLDDTVEKVYFKNPTTVNINDTKETILNICKIKKIHQIPVVDDDNNIVGLEILDELIGSTTKSNKVVLMVGGLGTRLRPLTETTPKPMLPVGGKPILQTIVEKFVSYGFVNIVMCIGYKSHVIQDFFNDGSKFGANIEYILEDKRMGTAGALSLLSDEQKPKEPFFVMNGDLLTNINFEHLLKFHEDNNSKATMCVREYDFQVPYGVVDIENGKIKAIDEKPVHKFFVSAGIYMLDSSCLTLIPNDEFYDMPTLFEKIIDIKENTISFPLREYWLDIGRMDEYEKANREYHEVF